MSTWRDEPEAERWNESKAVRLLQQAGALVAVYEAEGALIPNRRSYHARIAQAHDAQDMPAYREAIINGYVQAAREAYRRRREGHKA